MSTRKSRSKREENRETKATLLLVGLGELGGRLLEILARTPNFGWRIVVASRQAEAGRRRVNAALFSASYAEHFPELLFTRVDIEDQAAATELIAREKPAVVVNTATRSAWWIRGLLPDHIKDRLNAVGAGPGLWAAGHLAVTRRLVLALQQADCRAPLINAAYPDVVNPALAPLAPGPLVGIGNIDLLIPAVRYIVAEEFKISPRHVSPFIVAHNFHSSRILTSGALDGRLPFLKVLVSGTDVTPSLDLPRLFQRIPNRTPIPLGATSSAVAVGSLYRTVLAVLNDSNIMTHAPGPGGLPGGYPVEIGRAGARICLPESISMPDALAINLAGQRGEEIQEIRKDGTLVLTDVAAHVLRDVFGMTAGPIDPKDADAFSIELAERLRLLAGRYGIHSPKLRRSA